MLTFNSSPFIFITAKIHKSNKSATHHPPSSLKPFRRRIFSMNSRARCGAGAGSKGRLGTKLKGASKHDIFTKKIRGLIWEIIYI